MAATRPSPPFSTIPIRPCGRRPSSGRATPGGPTWPPGWSPPWPIRRPCAGTPRPTPSSGPAPRWSTPWRRSWRSCAGQRQADLLAVLARRPDPRYGPAALAAAADDLPALRAAAAELLGGVGGADAGRTLRGLLADSDAAVRVAAVDGLRRAGIEDAVPAIAPLLGDQAFAVRRAAGAALAALGPGGTLLLRHYTSAGDQYAADMARHALDVAALRRPGVTLE